MSHVLLRVHYLLNHVNIQCIRHVSAVLRSVGCRSERERNENAYLKTKRKKVGINKVVCRIWGVRTVLRHSHLLYQDFWRRLFLRLPWNHRVMLEEY